MQSMRPYVTINDKGAYFRNNRNVSNRHTKLSFQKTPEPTKLTKAFLHMGFLSEKPVQGGKALRACVSAKW